MIDAMPTPDDIPAAHTVPDLRVGMTVAVHDAADVEHLLGATVELEITRSRVTIESYGEDVRTGPAAWVTYGVGSGGYTFPMPLPVSRSCTIISLSRGETVDASELRATAKSVSFGRTEREAWDDVSRVRQSVDALRIHTALQDANARAAKLDAGGGDATGELAGLMRPSSNVHDEVTVDRDRVDAIKESLVITREQLLAKVMQANTPPGWWRYEQRERLTERGCEQIAREPELWECDGERVEVKP